MNKKHLINILIILVLGVIVYANSFGNEFVWDDRFIIVKNPYIKSLKNIGHLFYTEFFPKSEEFNYYRPLTAILNAIDYSIWKLNPLGYHLTNFTLHFITSCLVYTVLFYFFRSYLASLFLSLIFIAHPSATEAITYIPSRSEPLAFIFLILSLLSFDYWQRRSFQKKYYIFSVISFVLSCLSKETAVVFPAFLFFYIMITNKLTLQRFKNKIFSIVPYFVISFIYLLARQLVLKASGGLFFEQSPIGLSVRIISAPVIVLRYIIAFFTPKTFVMEQPVILYNHILNPTALISIISILVVLGLIIKFYQSKMALGGIWFLMFIFPVCGIISINSFFYHHWLYLPSLGLLIITADLIIKGSKFLKRVFYGLVFQRLLQLAGIAIIVFCCFITIKQNTYYRDELTLYKKTLEKHPNAARVHYNLGLVYAEMEQVEEAISEFKNAIRYKPNYTDAYLNLGYAYQMKGLIDKAEELFKEAMRVKPSSYLPYYYLANLYNDTGRFSESIELYKKSINLKEKNPDIYFDLGRAYDKNGDRENAIKTYQKAINLEPLYIDAYLNLGSIFAERGQFDKAKTTWGKGLKFDSGNLDIKRNLDKLERIESIHKK